MNLELRRAGAHLHTLMYTMFSRVPCENIGKMDLFRLADLPLVLLAGPVIAGQTYASLRTFQGNLGEREWPSLAEIYPRPMLWFYAYNLFFWSRYCNILPVVLSRPDRCLPAEIYLRLICQIDSYLDSFDSRGLLDHLVDQIENQPDIQAVRLELNRRLAVLLEEDHNGDFVMASVDTYLNHNLLAVRRWMASKTMTLEEIRVYKETTTGELYTTWSRILGYLYHVSEELAENAARIVCLYGMATQVVDDISDARQDYLVHSPNVFLGIAEGEPGEYERLISNICRTERKYMHWPWLKKNIPHSYEQATVWIQSYIDEIQALTHQKPLTDELSKLVARLIAIVGYEKVKF